MSEEAKAMQVTIGDGKAVVTRMFPLGVQVCVPAAWTDEQVKEFADRKYLCGTTAGWGIRREGHKRLGGDPERVPCADREGFVHIMLEA